MTQLPPYSPHHDVVAEPRAGARGCLLWGCLGVFVVGTLLMIGAASLGYVAVASQVKKYTSDKPAELPEIQYPPEALAELEQRIERFQRRIQPPPSETAAPATSDPATEPSGATVAEESAASGGATAEALPAESPATEELVLTADDINALIGQEEELRGKVFVKIQQGTITGDLSVPIDSFVPGSKGRYLNASGTFDVSLQDGVLIVTLQQAEVRGEPVPEAIMNTLREQNLAKDLYNDPDNAQVMRRFESIEVQDDRIVVRVREE